jgi:DnaK suppressor protein
MGDDFDLAVLERALRERQAELHAKIEALAAAPERGSSISFGKRVGDGTTEAIQRLNEIGVGNSLVVAEERVTRALAKIDDGTYGVCDVCGGPIAAARLRAFPESVTCIDCARH